MATPTTKVTALPPDQMSKAVEEMHRRVLSAPDRARTSVQLGGGLSASAFVAALFASGNLNLFDEPLWVLLLGLISLIVWLVAVGLFVWAAMTPSPDQSETEDFNESVSLGRAMARFEAKEVRRRGSVALIPVALGAFLTGATVTTAATVDKVSEYRVVLTTEGAGVLSRLCRFGTPWEVTVSVEGDGLERDPAEFIVKDPDCDGKPIRLSQQHVSGFGPP